MKNSFLFFLLAFMILLSVQPAFSQDNICENGYMPFKEGISFELTNYDKKGKETSTARHKVTKLEKTYDSFKASVEITVKDQKGKTTVSNNYFMECRDEVLTVDMSSMLDPRSMESMSSMEMEMTGDALQFPRTLTPGQTLPDGTMTLKAKTSGIVFMSIIMEVKNRQVGDQETITTPAGTFDCIKISQDTEIRSLIKNTYRSTTWYAIGIGMVKSENYDKKGNLESSTVLTKLER